VGRIRHRRHGTPEHQFSYGIWHALLDLDRIPETCAEVPLLSHNRFNLLGFHDRDHMGPHPGAVRDKLESWFASQGLELPAGRVLLLTGLRHLGYGFNPVSFYFCHDTADELMHVVAEVNNTFGETLCYLLDGSTGRRVVRHREPKRFHVSPFHPVEGEYDFTITRPGDRLTIHMDLVRNGERIFDATLSSRRQPLTNRSLLAAVAHHAHLSALVVGRIHWQALRLWIKGAPFFSKPPMPKTAWRTHNG
jgi:DUF1365 family protein